MRVIIDSIREEYERYKGLGEGALGQLSDGELALAPGGHGNSAAAIVRHISGNLASRFTDFLAADGEKAWRDRESEFEKRTAARANLMEDWEAAWAVLISTLAGLADEDLGTTVTIRGQPLAVRQALHRSLAHTASHVGQIVFHAKSIRGGDWRYLSIPPGQSVAYNANPVLEKAPRPAVSPVSIMEEMAGRLERCVGGSMWHGPSLGGLREGITAAEACAHPVAGAHSIAELIRHMAVWADFARQRLRDEEAAELTDAEDWPPGDPVDEQDLRAQWSRLDSAYHGLAAEVRTLTEVKLAATVRGRRYTVGDMVRGVAEHAAYHGGQIALLRRALRVAAP
jgi:uncharacterized damage-inducible protein DinB